jgi:hypothetical protein
MEQQRTRDAEDRRVGSNPEGERKDGGGCEPRRSQAGPERVADVMSERIHAQNSTDSM